MCVCEREDSTTGLDRSPVCVCLFVMVVGDFKTSRIQERPFSFVMAFGGGGGEIGGELEIGLSTLVLPMLAADMAFTSHCTGCEWDRRTTLDQLALLIKHRLLFKKQSNNIYIHTYIHTFLRSKKNPPFLTYQQTPTHPTKIHLLRPPHPRHLDPPRQLPFKPPPRHLLLRQPIPRLNNPGPSRGQHAVLQTVEAPSVDRGQEPARHEAEDDAGGEVVGVEAVAEAKVLVEHGAEGEGDGLDR